MQLLTYHPLPDQFPNCILHLWQVCYRHSPKFVVMEFHFVCNSENNCIHNIPPLVMYISSTLQATSQVGQFTMQLGGGNLKRIMGVTIFRIQHFFVMLSVTKHLVLLDSSGTS